MINIQVLLKRSCAHGVERRWNTIPGCRAGYCQQVITVDRIWQDGDAPLRGVPPLYPTAEWTKEE